jgi:hypothetical protein
MFRLSAFAAERTPITFCRDFSICREFGIIAVAKTRHPQGLVMARLLRLSGSGRPERVVLFYDGGT